MDAETGTEKGSHLPGCAYGSWPLLAMVISSRLAAG